jgi:putative transcription antitermination factor YqgF
MNCLSIDYGTKTIGLAYSVNDIICPLPPIVNDNRVFDHIKEIIISHKIERVYVGISYGRVAKLTQKFIKEMSVVIKLPVETVDEAASTIEADRLMADNHKSRKNRSKSIDSVSAAVILHRVIN